jgi:hypothetical protein
MSGIAGADAQSVEDALRDYANTHGGSVQRCPSTEETWEFLIVSEAQPGRVTVVYPGEFMDWDDAALHLSKSLRKPVFSFHIHDDDLWMYLFFVNGVEVDQFNPIPDYWSADISDEERLAWKGNADVIARYWPDVSAADLRDYLVAWDLDDETPGKANPADGCKFGDCWQLVDFMRRLGLDYPVDDRGQASGETYRFQVEGM